MDRYIDMDGVKCGGKEGARGNMVKEDERGMSFLFLS